MTMKVTNDEGEEIEVYTAAELEEAKTGAVAETTTKLTEAEKEKIRLEGLLADRASEFQGFRKLSEEQVKKLDAAQLTIYQNGLALEAEREKNVKLETERTNNQIAAAIKAKTGADQKAFDKVKEMYDALNITAGTPEEIERKVLAAIGAIGTTQPDIAATIAGFSSGTYAPPVVKKDGESFADSERGKAAGAELGLTLETPKK